MNRKGSIVAQTLINLVIFAMFMHIAFQSIYSLSKPITINHLKYEYLQLQLDYLSSLYDGIETDDDRICFKENHCLEYNHNRLVLTPGYQILMENVQSYEILELDNSMQIRLLHFDKKVVINVKK